MTSTTVVDLPVDSIAPQCNDRKDFTGIEALAESIKHLGLIEPIIVRPAEGTLTETYWLVGGERRWRAHKLLGLATIQCIVADHDDETASGVMLAENTARHDLNPMAEAYAFQTRIDNFGWDHKQIAERAGVTVARVQQRLDLLKLRPEAQHLVATGQLKHGNAWELTRLDADRQMIVLKAMATQNLSWFDIESMCAHLLADQQADSMFDPDDFMVIEEFVAKTKSKRLGRVGLLSELRNLVAALDGESLSPEAAAALAHAVDVVATQTDGMKTKV
jgi:ParB family chromosome partitioning protein